MIYEFLTVSYTICQAQINFFLDSGFGHFGSTVKQQNSKVGECGKGMS